MALHYADDISRARGDAAPRDASIDIQRGIARGQPMPLQAAAQASRDRAGRAGMPLS